MLLPNIKTIEELNEYMQELHLIIPVYFNNNTVFLLDQLRLPFEEVYMELRSVEDIAKAIVNMNIRGGGAIPIAAAYGLLLASRQGLSLEAFKEKGDVLRQTRPTASSLFAIIERLEQAAMLGNEQVETEIIAFVMEKIDYEMAIAEIGAKLLADGSTVLTHCHAGALAGCGFGNKTFGMLKKAHEAGKKIQVYATETRPYLQGARITTWELQRAGIPNTLITDNMVGYFLAQGIIDLTVVGADRIAGNGDVVNKVGTYPIALTCKDNNVPFYVGAFPEGIDLSVQKGVDIPIEMRNPSEVTSIGFLRVATPGVQAQYPSFDVTPNRLITAFITPEGLIEPPYFENLNRYLTLGG